MRYNFSKYLGIPYKNNGRSFDGVDCFGLVSLVFAIEKKITLPDYSENRELINCSINKDEHLLGSLTKLWRLVKDEEFNIFDVHVFLDDFASITHSGINIGYNKFLHALEDRVVEIGKVDIWKKKMVLTMRYIEDAKDHI